MRRMTTKHRTRRLLSAAVISFLTISATAGSASAQVFDQDYSGGSEDSLFKGSLGVYSDRTFRGQNLYDGTSLQAAGQAGIGTGIGLAYIGGFAHFSSDRNHGGENEKSFEEFDFEFGHKFFFEEMQLALGHRWLTYSRSTARLRDTGEFFAEVTTDVIGHPSFLATYDHDEHKGWYYEAGLEQPIPLGLNNDRDAIVPSVTLGMSSSLDGGSHPIYEENGIAFIDVGLRAIFNLTDGISFEPDFHYTEYIDDATTSDFVFGVNLVGQMNQQ